MLRARTNARTASAPQRVNRCITLHPRPRFPPSFLLSSHLPSSRLTGLEVPSSNLGAPTERGTARPCGLGESVVAPGDPVGDRERAAVRAATYFVSPIDARALGGVAV